MAEWSIGELSKRAEMTPRTIRYYVELGLLAPPKGAGKLASYGPEHLERLQVIRRLQGARLSLDEIRDELASLPGDLSSEVAADFLRRGSSASDYLARLREEVGPYDRGRERSGIKPMAANRERQAERGESFVAEPWTRIPLSEDVELHVRRRGNRADSRIGRLIEEARRILKEEERR